MKFGGKSIMVRGAMNSIGYEEVLKKGLLPIYEADNNFQQDVHYAINSKLSLLF